MIEFLQLLFHTSDFPARWVCGNWSAGHGWLHIISDTAIWGAYMAIPATLAYFILRRTDFPFPPIFWLFAAFIFFCGTTHLIEAGIFWWPAYRLSGVMKLATATVSWATVFALLPVIPRALALPGLSAVNTELNRALEATKKSEERFRVVIEAAPNGMVMVDGNGTIVLANTACAEIFGYAPDELVGESIEILVPPRLREEHPAFRKAFLKAPEARLMGHGRDLYGLRKDGAEIPVEIGLNPIEPAEEPLVLASIVDITERKRDEEALARHTADLEEEVKVRRRAEAALRESLDQVHLFSSVVQSSEDAILIKDLEGTITGWNPAAERLYGYTAEEAIGKNIALIVPEHRKGELDEILTQLQGGSGVSQLRTERRHKSGRLIDVSLTISHVRSETGETIGASDIARDITQQLVAEEKFRQVVESAPSGIALVDDQGRIELVNEETERLFGYEREELAGALVEVLVPERSREKHPDMRAAYMKSPASRRMGEGRELYGRRKDGSEFPIEVGLNPIHLRGGTMVLSVIVDITERKRAAEEVAHYTEELKRSNEELETFAYVASHDLQEPLRMVASYVELLANRYAGQLDEKADKYIYYAVDGAKRMKQLINDLLDFSRVNTTGKALEPTDTESVLQRVVHTLDFQIQEAGAEVTWDSLPEVRADATQLGQVFQNLLGNAMKFASKTPPRIHIAAVTRGDLWEFSVQDNGIGIDPQYAERIFQLFQRLNTREEYAGTGIGLTVARKIVERHGGAIWFDSKPGQGTTFYFTIPGIRDTLEIR